MMKKRTAWMMGALLCAVMTTMGILLSDVVELAPLSAGGEAGRSIAVG